MMMMMIWRGKNILLIVFGIILLFALWRMFTQREEYLENNLTLYDIELIDMSNSYAIPSLNDFKKLIDISDFKFLLNQSGCSSDSNIPYPLVIILIFSAPLNHVKRQIIRDTWGQVNSQARVYFLMGAVKLHEHQLLIEDENRKHSDIIQGSFEDQYRNLTYKHMMALKWIIYHCPDVRYIVKIDDDAFLNTQYLFDYLETKANEKNLIFCNKLTNATTQRSKRSKWYVTKEEYPDDYYPPYCEGASIIYSGDVILNLYEVAQQVKYFWIDDVHITGVMAQKLNLNITNAAEYILTGNQLNKAFAGNFSDFNPEFVLVRSDLKGDQIKLLWNQVSFFNGRNSTTLV